MSIEGLKELVVAMYDYSYVNDDGQMVKMKKDEKYILVESTNDEWWQVQRGDDDIFYVPANYVERLGTEDETNSAGGGAEQQLMGLGEKMMSTFQPKKYPPSSIKETEDDNGEVLYVNSEDVSSFCKVQVVNSNPAAQMTGIDDYANLDDYRQLSRTPPKEAEDDESIYANLLELQPCPAAPPSPDEGEYVKTLLGIWKLYRDPKTSRNYYYHIETHELTWKPPRHPDRLSDKEKKNGLRENVTDTGDVFYVNDSTKEKFLCSKNEKGQKYLSRLGSLDTAQVQQNEFPKKNGDILQDDGLGLSTKVDRLQRGNRAQSMVLDLDFNQPPNVPKSSTLPANMSHDQLLPSAEIDGIMQRTKILENGKKTKKNWSMNYVKLVGSNLVFYKDQKAATVKPGYPYGKVESIVSLRGAEVQYNPKDTSSKKNIIKLCDANGNHFLLRVDDEIKLFQWLKKIYKTISDLNPGMKMDSSQPDRNKPSTSKGHSRSGSVDENSEKKSKIREMLRNLITRRPPIETLERKGIIRETVFGAHLKHICEQECTKVPNFVRLCITAIEARGLDHDGLYRVSGNLAQIQKLRFAVDQDEVLDLNDVELWDVHVLAGALKLFFRELKEPLFPFHLFEKFKDAIVKPASAERLNEVCSYMPELPKCNYDTIKMLFSHLLRVIDLSHENRMQVQNIAIVFGPTLIWPENEHTNIAASMVFQGRIIEYFLMEYKKLFK